MLNTNNVAEGGTETSVGSPVQTDLVLENNTAAQTSTNTTTVPKDPVVGTNDPIKSGVSLTEGPINEILIPSKLTLDGLDLSNYSDQEIANIRSRYNEYGLILNDAVNGIDVKKALHKIAFQHGSFNPKGGPTDREVIDIDTEAARSAFLADENLTEDEKFRYERAMQIIDDVNNRGLKVVRGSKGNYWFEGGDESMRKYALVGIEEVRDVLENYMGIGVSESDENDDEGGDEGGDDNLLPDTDVNYNKIVDPDDPKAVTATEEDITGFNQYEKAYGASIVIDLGTSITGMLMKFSGAGAPLGVATGLVGGLFAGGVRGWADIMDPEVSGWEAAQNFVATAGFELIEAVAGVPIGMFKYFKHGTRTFSILNKAIRMGAATLSAQAGAEVIMSFNSLVDKINDPDETLTLEDWRKLATATALIGSVLTGTITNKRNSAKQLNKDLARVDSPTKQIGPGGKKPLQIEGKKSKTQRQTEKTEKIARDATGKTKSDGTVIEVEPTKKVPKSGEQQVKQSGTKSVEGENLPATVKGKNPNLTASDQELMSSGKIAESTSIPAKPAKKPGKIKQTLDKLEGKAPKSEKEVYADLENSVGPKRAKKVKSMAEDIRQKEKLSPEDYQKYLKNKKETAAKQKKVSDEAEKAKKIKKKEDKIKAKETKKKEGGTETKKVDTSKEDSTLADAQKKVNKSSEKIKKLRDKANEAQKANNSKKSEDLANSIKKEKKIKKGLVKEQTSAEEALQKVKNAGEKGFFGRVGDRISKAYKGTTEKPKNISAATKSRLKKIQSADLDKFFTKAGNIGRQNLYQDVLGRNARVIPLHILNQKDERYLKLSKRAVINRLEQLGYKPEKEYTHQQLTKALQYLEADEKGRTRAGEPKRKLTQKQKDEIKSTRNKIANKKELDKQSPEARNKRRKHGGILYISNTVPKAQDGMFMRQQERIMLDNLKNRPGESIFDDNQFAGVQATLANADNFSKDRFAEHRLFNTSDRSTDPLRAMYNTYGIKDGVIDVMRNTAKYFAGTVTNVGKTNLKKGEGEGSGTGVSPLLGPADPSFFERAAKSMSQYDWTTLLPAGKRIENSYNIMKTAPVVLHSRPIEDLPGYSKAMSDARRIKRVDTADAFIGENSKLEQYNNNQRNRNDMAIKNAAYITEQRNKQMDTSNANRQAAAGAQAQYVNQLNQAAMQTAQSKTAADTAREKVRQDKVGQGIKGATRYLNDFINAGSNAKNKEGFIKYKNLSNIYNNEYMPRIKDKTTTQANAIKNQFEIDHGVHPDKIGEVLGSYIDALQESNYPGYR